MVPRERQLEAVRKSGTEMTVSVSLAVEHNLHPGVFCIRGRGVDHELLLGHSASHSNGKDTALWCQNPFETSLTSLHALLFVCWSLCMARR